jgi:hypothetical protein
MPAYQLLYFPQIFPFSKFSPFDAKANIIYAWDEYDKKPLFETSLKTKYLLPHTDI